MAALVGGLAAALFWGIAGLVNGHASRLVGAPVAVAWALLTGFVVVTVLAGVSGWPADAASGDWVWAVIAGVGTIGGLLLSYESYRRGKLGVVAPIVATQGAIAAVLAVIAGEDLDPVAAPFLALVVVGVLLAATGGERGEEPVSRRTSAIAPLVALAGALSFGFALFAASQVGDGLGSLWVAFVPRAVGMAAVVLPVALMQGLRVPRAVRPLVAIGGTIEVSGYVSFILAARDNAAIASVMASQFAIVTALGGLLLWSERLARTQVAGIAVVLVGVGVLAALQA